MIALVALLNLWINSNNFKYCTKITTLVIISCPYSSSITTTIWIWIWWITIPWNITICTITICSTINIWCTISTIMTNTRYWICCATSTWSTTICNSSTYLNNCRSISTTTIEFINTIIPCVIMTKYCYIYRITCTFIVVIFLNYSNLIINTHKYNKTKKKKKKKKEEKVHKYAWSYT